MKIIYEDDYFIAIDKEAGIEVDNNLINAIKKEYTYIDNLYLVHRIDKFTSGIVILARDEETKKYFEESFKNKTINKVYHAIVQGKVEKEKGTIDISIGIDKKNPNRRIPLSVKEGGESAITHYKVLKRLNEHTLLELKPLTGRTHQIRVHLSYIGHPIIGDKIYSKNADIYKMKGFALIAKEVHFVHPFTKKDVNIDIKYNKEFLIRLKLLESRKRI
ncbi:Pseudouridine synthase, RsuA/RluD family [Brachyspira intermedia PWS/A]|uniref:Pseudouridine synthase, RsuA/RluD family n=1 Tax=Brachyspira intermedia (strain ATCC 51140 / PWS/A) TaxID=1045858 RepID=G0EKY7_BRAIP|nr:RluA family pseudouridine synthase [Brachyspira intermedia]AEM22643.1 Pseudouridine synthase, RsuA/RluD family [Brachyspira intermedia PWS/A]